MTEKQIVTRIRQIMYDRKLSGTESNAGELNRLKTELKALRGKQGVTEGNNSSPFNQEQNLRSKSDKELADLIQFWNRALEKNPEHKIAREQLGLIKMIRAERIGKQGVAEGAPELLKKEMPLHRHAEKLLAQNGVSKDDPDYHHHLNNTIKHLRQFGNIDLINKQGVAEGERTMSRAAKGNEKYGKDGMKALAKAGREGDSEKELDAIRDQYDKYTEGWSQKYKNSINCSHPKGFSQKAHCAGKKKHNEDINTEMTCPDCGMCQAHGRLDEIKKGQKDSNGNTKCWPGKHAEGTKKSSVTGKPVRNCVPNESVAEETKNIKGSQKMREDTEAEGATVKNSLHTIIRVATHLDRQMGEDEDFPEWVSEKIGSVKDQMVAVMDYEISNKEMQGVAEANRNQDRHWEDEAEQEMSPDKNSPYYVFWTGQSHEWYGDGDPESGDGRYKPKGEAGGIVSINIKDRDTAEKIADSLNAQAEDGTFFEKSIYNTCNKDDYLVDYMGAEARSMKKIDEYEQRMLDYDLKSGRVKDYADQSVTEGQLNEFVAALLPEIVAGARIALPYLGRILGSMGRGTGNVIGKTATGVGRGTVDVAKAGVNATAQNAGKVGLGVGAAEFGIEAGKGAKNAISDIGHATSEVMQSVPKQVASGLEQVYTDTKSAAGVLTQILGKALDGITIGKIAKYAVEYAVPLVTVIAILYGGKKLIDKVLSEQDMAEGGMGGINRCAPSNDVSYEKVLDEVKQQWKRNKNTTLESKITTAVDYIMSEEAHYKQIGIKVKGSKQVPNCVPVSEHEVTLEGDVFMGIYENSLLEADYHGHKVQLGKPMQGDVKKFKVYVKDPKTGNIKKVNFGDPNMRIRKSNPGARKSFRARHHCENPGPKTKARYWSCRQW